MFIVIICRGTVLHDNQTNQIYYKYNSNSSTIEQNRRLRVHNIGLSIALKLKTSIRGKKKKITFMNLETAPAGFRKSYPIETGFLADTNHYLPICIKPTETPFIHSLHILINSSRFYHSPITQGQFILAI